MIEQMDKAVLTTLVTAFLIREGGRCSFTAKEWEEAIEHSGSLFINRKDSDDPMQVALMQQVIET